jgi:hypothetical protein
MRFERVRPGEYRAPGKYPGDYIWVVREGSRRWYWFVGGYSGFDWWAVWEVGPEGPFTTKREALKDVIRKVLN